jgi:hypothetical protein
MAGLFVIAATDRRMDINDFRAFTAKSGEDAGLIHVQDETTLEEYLTTRNPLLLTDDYAPTDVLIAPSCSSYVAFSHENGLTFPR